jgi:hypothetical protein
VPPPRQTTRVPRRLRAGGAGSKAAGWSPNKLTAGPYPAAPPRTPYPALCSES